MLPRQDDDDDSVGEAIYHDLDRRFRLQRLGRLQLGLDLDGGDVGYPGYPGDVGDVGISTCRRLQTLGWLVSAGIPLTRTVRNYLPGGRTTWRRWEFRLLFLHNEGAEAEGSDIRVQTCITKPASFFFTQTDDDNE